MITLKHSRHMTYLKSSPPKITDASFGTFQHLPADGMKNVTTVILGGGTGTRLYPLTFTRCKPAIPFGGRFKLIDVPISNALNSGCNKIYIISQFLSSTLHQHILKTYRMDTFAQGCLELLSAEQKPSKSSWFKGTADAVRQNLEYLKESPADYILILSGDQLYRMNFQEMLNYAIQKDADMVVASLPVDERCAKRMGLLKSDSNHNIIDFTEKPQDKETLEAFSVGTGEKPFLGSMGIYLFKRKALFDLLEEDSREDFGKHLIQTQVKKGNVATYIYNGYWEDIGTVDSFFHANLNLTKPKPMFDCYNEISPIYSSTTTLPGPKLFNTEVCSSIISEGAFIEAKRITDSIIGPRTVIGKDTVIEQCYFMGNETYGTRSKNNFSVGQRCVIKKAILDKQVIIGDDVHLTNANNCDFYDGDGIYIRDGIIIVTPGTTIPNGFTL
ncbi:Glucose-1-phosphate adenylyltransferase [Chlamydiales bacterium STE3]|nr:Glucose-1-phosphate adenylyltransferase [Chlamydiales bacterium STE3]